MRKGIEPMKQTRMMGRAAVMGAMGIWLWGTAGAAWAEPAAMESAGAEPRPALVQDLCGAVEEAIRLLEENQMGFSNGEARQAVLESLIRASEPSVSFLDEDTLAARERRLSQREWDTGLTLMAVEDGLPKVAAVRTNSPAAAAGILPGEWIEKVAGHDLTTGTSIQVVREQLVEGEEPALELGIRSVDEKSRGVVLERVRRAETSLADVEELPAAMGYLRVEGIFPGAGAEIAGVLERWKSASVFGAILDMRGAAGLAEEEIPQVAAHFVPMDSTLYTRSDRKGRELVSVKAPAAPAASLPMMVLVDEETTGAAELLAAVLGGSVQGVMIIGRPTAGDPLLREPRKLSSGKYALLATRQLRTADGAVYAGSNGLQPDVVITEAALNETVYEPEEFVLRKGKEPSEEEKEDKALRERTRNDTYLRRATDVLLGLRALGFGPKR